jgi:PRC-barrel domain
MAVRKARGDTLLCGLGDRRLAVLTRALVTLVVLATAGVGIHPAAAQHNSGEPALILTAGPAPEAKSPDRLSPEEKMQRRYPQPVKVGDLIGLRVLDHNDRTLGRVRSVVRTASGKIQLIVPYGGILGFRQRLVAVPIEVVGIAGRQLAALDMTRAEFDAAPAWNDPQSQPIPADDLIRVGLYKR